MKRIYWRPRNVSRPILAGMALVSIAGLAAVERFHVQGQPRDYQAMWDSAQRAAKAMEVIRQARAEADAIQEEVDPAGSGLIGRVMTEVTSDPGFLSAKQTSVNPNWAAVVLKMLKQAGVRPGDTVAIGYSGSFPALNICVSAAVETLQLKPVIISSVAASQWGANDPEFLWLDMERLLTEQGVLAHRSVAASLGGFNDIAVGMSKRGRELLEEATERNEVPRIQAANAAESIDERMRIYREGAAGEPIKAYINVGGGTTSVGGPAGKRTFREGLNLRRPPGKLADSIMLRFVEAGVPVIHLVRIEQLAEKYGLPTTPQTFIKPGNGAVFQQRGYSRWLAGAVLLVIVLGLYGFIHSTLGHRLMQSAPRRKEDVLEEPMV